MARVNPLTAATQADARHRARCNALVAEVDALAAGTEALAERLGVPAVLREKLADLGLAIEGLREAMEGQA